ncbi:MAG: hypothetical protein ABI446_13725 [Gemmatimonadaceae bacterium]
MSSEGAPVLAEISPQGEIGSASAPHAQAAEGVSHARELAAAEVASAAPTHNGDHGLLAAVVACEQSYRALSRSIGRSSAHAIMSRALLQTQSESPILEQIVLDRESDHALSGIAEVIRLRGASQVSAALQSMLAHAFELLGRLVGPDIVQQLVTQNVSSEKPDDEDAT